jgi:tRNA-dihydrouridine synthase 2
MTLSVEEKAALLYKGEALAPMVRASTTPLRTLALKYGADFCYTEELIDRSLTDTARVENAALGTIDYIKDASKMAARQQRKLLRDGGPALYLRIDPAVERGRLVCQIGTGDAALALAAAQHVHRDVCAVDVNMGCPKKFSVAGGMGSALLDDVDRACRIVRTLTNEISSTSSRNPIPVSAKIRLLKDAQATLDFITALISAGAKAVAIHGRRVGDPEVKAADWETLETVVSLATSKFPTTPILVNGDFYTRDEFTDFTLKTGASGVLLARTALYNTSVFCKPTVETVGTYGYKSPLLLDKSVVIQDYLKEAVKYDTHYKNIKYVVCEMMNSRRAPHGRVPCLPQQFVGGQTIGKTCACPSLRDICLLWNVNYDAELKLRGNVEGAAALLPGEHIYLDSYIMNSASDGADTRDPPSKRVRVDSSF